MIPTLQVIRMYRAMNGGIDLHAVVDVDEYPKVENKPLYHTPRNSAVAKVTTKW